MDELYINGQKADMTDSAISLKYENSILGRIGEIESSYSFTISLPKTARNCNIFKMAHLPNVRTINGTKVIGDTLSIIYTKDGINVLGDAIGYLDGITEDAFEVSIYFGVMGAFGDWQESEKSLKDAGDYSHAYTTFDNALTPYSDNLPDLFKPYYDVGVEMDATALATIVRLPAVRLLYVMRIIEQESGCVFRFPDNVVEAFNKYAIPLHTAVRKSGYIMARYSELDRKTTVSLDAQYAMIPIGIGRIDVNSDNTGKYIYTAYDNDTLYDLATFNGVKALADGRLMFNTEVVVLHDGTAQTTATEIAVAMIKFSDAGAQIIEETKRTWSAQPYYVSQLSWAVQYETDVVVGDRFGFVVLMTGQYLTTDHISVKSGYIDVSTSYVEEIQYTNVIPQTLMIQAKENMPDIPQVDFLQGVCDMFGLFPAVNPRPERVNGKPVINFLNFETLMANREVVYRNGMPVNDWTDRLVTPPDMVSLTITKDGYYQRNIMTYAEDSTVTLVSKTYFDIPDVRLEKEGTVVELPFANSEQDKIVMYSLEVDDDGNREYTLETFTPRIMEIKKHGIDGVDYTKLEFTEHMTMQRIMFDRYMGYIDVVSNMYVIKAKVLLSTLDLANIDYTLPVYFKQWGRWFGVKTIEASTDSNVCDVELLRLEV